MHERATRRRALLVAVAGVLAAGCASRRKDPLAGVRATLAPAGRLRMGLQLGSPVSITGDPMSPDARGVGLELGRALANRLDAPFEAVTFPRSAEVAAALRAQRVDLAFLGVSHERDRELAFAAPVLHLEQGFLVRAGSAARTAADVDRTGMRVGASAGSAAAAQLGASLKEGKVVPAATMSAAIAMLAGGQLDAFAGNKAALHRMAASLPGARMVEGRWGVERFALAIPASREAGGLAFVQRFGAEAEREGLVDRAVQSAGLRGVVPPGAR
jgi:polar amino acid transport system substrate-binding protein